MFRHLDHDLIGTIEPDPLLAIHMRQMYTERSIHARLKVSNRKKRP